MPAPSLAAGCRHVYPGLAAVAHPRPARHVQAREARPARPGEPRPLQALWSAVLASGRAAGEWLCMSRAWPEHMITVVSTAAAKEGAAAHQQHVGRSPLLTLSSAPVLGTGQPAACRERATPCSTPAPAPCPTCHPAVHFHSSSLQGAAKGADQRGQGKEQKAARGRGAAARRPRCGPPPCLAATPPGQTLRAGQG